jgi:hypothetical protein
MLKSILTQAIAMAVVWGVNALVSRWVDPSLWWGVVAAWILIDDVGVYQDLKLMTKRHDDLLQKFESMDKEYTQCLRHKHEQIKFLSTIVLENSKVLADVKKQMKKNSSSDTSTQSGRFSERNIQKSGNSCIW